jgi:hypothetical protein
MQKWTSKLSVFQWIEMWYNTNRIHSSLGNKGSFEISGDLTIFEVQYFRNENRLFS